ncbi:guanylate kinase [Ruminococcus sp.]|uniref:guanylate kinase n=1 Tax=Ruminococcus sp. TaxID=41978 RepID=UPI0025F43DD6|nr:guanylate kinase [Ruminococcus sp.]MCI5815917.1 guanylate kinase [Ruminococcus sp.]MDD7555975.1 guanylate kinase [Ruminococcus sp.]MDY4963085.1 guanylate kinase [Ruminococcus callidus]
MRNKGLLLVVSAPSGCGKGTILGEILKDEGFYYSISATTRAPREGEQDGVNYHFITKEEFEQRIARGGMLEYAQYCGNYYGTPKKEVEQMREAGRDVILEIEVEGAMKVRSLCPDAVFLFIAPPSVEELRRRLNKRGTEAAEVIEERVAQASRELSYADRYDYIIVNGELEKAIDDFRTIVRAEKLRTKNGNKIDEVLNHA